MALRITQYLIGTCIHVHFRRQVTQLEGWNVESKNTLGADMCTFRLLSMSL